MNKPNTKCRVCGKNYFCCSDSRKIGSWRTMACSTECFREYMERIGTSRNPMTKELHVTTKDSETGKAKTRKKTANHKDI